MPRLRIEPHLLHRLYHRLFTRRDVSVGWWTRRPSSIICSTFSPKFSDELGSGRLSASGGAATAFADGYVPAACHLKGDRPLRGNQAQQEASPWCFARSRLAHQAQGFPARSWKLTR